MKPEIMRNCVYRITASAECVGIRTSHATGSVHGIKRAMFSASCKAR